VQVVRILFFQRPGQKGSGFLISETGFFYRDHRVPVSEPVCWIIILPLDVQQTADFSGMNVPEHITIFPERSQGRPF